jgi:diguanylate cyclase (GGDEF)-like protein/PAS domain S-box-containing protein
MPGPASATALGKATARADDAQVRPSAGPTRSLQTALSTQSLPSLAALHLLMQLHAGVVVHALDTRIIFSNPRAAELLGLSEAQLLGKTAIDPAWHFLNGQGQPIDAAQYPINRVLATGQALHETDFGVASPQRDGITWLSVSAFPQVDAAGQLAGVVVNFHDISERRRAQAQLERARAFALSVLDGLTASVCVLDSQGAVLAVNKAWRDFHLANGGDSAVVHEGLNYLQVACAAPDATTPAPGATSFAGLLQQVLGGERDHFEWEYPCHSPQEQRWFIARVSRMRGVEPLRVVVAHDNITQAKRGQEDLREALAFSHKLIDSMQDGFSVLDREGRASHANPALCQMTGFTAAELVGRSAPFPYWPPEEHARIDAALRATLLARGGDFELTFMRKNGERFPVSVAASAVLDAQGLPTAYLATVKDITQVKRMQDEIQRLAFHDALTDLPNRRLFEDRLQRAQAAALRSGGQGAVLMIDLDGFKAVNDLHGHDAGDLLLVEAARRLKACLREVDTAARLGGDEFVVVIDGLGGTSAEAALHAQSVAGKVSAALARPYSLAVDGVATRAMVSTCTASIGVALFAGHEQAAVEAMRLADRALYEAKRQGGNRVCRA